MKKKEEFSAAITPAIRNHLNVLIWCSGYTVCLSTYNKVYINMAHL